jgi:hypothetical protein
LLLKSSSTKVCSLVCSVLLTYRVQDLEEELVSRVDLVLNNVSPFLYDIVVTHALEWPTLTTQWFPDKETYRIARGH